MASGNKGWLRAMQLFLPLRPAPTCACALGGLTTGFAKLIICLYYVTLERANMSKRLIIGSTLLWIMLVNQTCRGSYTRCNTQHKGGFAKKPVNWFDKNILYSMDMSQSKYFSVRMSFKNNHA